jgi:hypothetical protein
MKVSPPDDQRRANERERRRRERGGRRREDWPDDSGLTACPTCGGAILQSLGANDNGEYLWHCPACRRGFETQRASRVLL